MIEQSVVCGPFINARVELFITERDGVLCVCGWQIVCRDFDHQR